MTKEELVLRIATVFADVAGEASAILIPEEYRGSEELKNAFSDGVYKGISFFEQVSDGMNEICSELMDADLEAAYNDAVHELIELLKNSDGDD